MGAFYTNFCVRSDDPQAIGGLLKAEGRAALVSPSIGGWVVVFDQACESQEIDELQRLGELLSVKTGSVVFSALNHDDSVLLLDIFDRGQPVDTYNSCPNYFDEEGAEEPEGGDANAVCRAVGLPEAASALEAVLHASNESDEYFMATDRHAGVVETLGLPGLSVGTGYTYAMEDPEMLEGVTFGDLLEIG
ncbi:MAG: hypothetical protein AAGF47_06410 [Planctomycetota bacterium]